MKFVSDIVIFYTKYKYNMCRNVLIKSNNNYIYSRKWQRIEIKIYIYRERMMKNVNININEKLHQS